MTIVRRGTGIDKNQIHIFGVKVDAVGFINIFANHRLRESIHCIHVRSIMVTDTQPNFEIVCYLQRWMISAPMTSIAS